MIDVLEYTGLQQAHNQWGKSDIAVTRTIYDGASNFIIPFTFPPFVAVTNIAPVTLDNDNWTSSAVKKITINNFDYMTAQNNVTSICWAAVGFQPMGIQEKRIRI